MSYLEGIRVALRGVGATLSITAVAVVIGVALGLLIALMRMSKEGAERNFNGLYRDVEGNASAGTGPFGLFRRTHVVEKLRDRFHMERTGSRHDRLRNKFVGIRSGNYQKRYTGCG